MEKWKKATQEELGSLQEKGVYTEMSLNKISSMYKDVGKLVKLIPRQARVDKETTS